ncbi:MAG: response regulator [Acetobacteraceae bacterium]|nr:response regulator [Acetobacteraceae bacterium]
MSQPPDPRLRAAHDLNNLLAAIIARAEAALEMKRTGPAVRAELEEIRLRAQEGAVLVRRFLGEEGRGVAPTPVGLGPLLREWAEELRLVLGPDRRLELGIADQSILARADADALRRALRDLAMNARDATGRGGVLTLRLDRLRLDHAAPAVPDPVPPGEWAVGDVSDNGAGIPPDLLARVFEPFFTTKKPGRGSGIGLDSVRAALKGMGGVVTIASVPGRGTTLRLHLPFVGTATGTVLLVEDEPALRRVAAKALREAGWGVTEADSAEAALAQLARGAAHPDLLVADVALPAMDGPALLARLRRERPGLPAILVSGYGEASQPAAPEALRLGKPYKPAELVGLVAQALKNNLRTDD